MTVAEFDYDACLSAPMPTEWTQRGLHWHAYTWRGTGKDWADDSLRNSDTAEVTPNSVRAWLRRPARQIRAAFTTPQEAVAWLREQWEPVVRDALHPVPEWARGESHYQHAECDLAYGSDLSWAMWVRGPWIVSLSLVGTPDRCHPVG